MTAGDYVAPDQQADGAIMTAAIWNQDVVNNTKFLYAPPGAVAARQVAGPGLTLPAGEISLIEWDTILFDTDSMESSDGSYSLICQTAGLYLVYASILMSSVAGADSGFFWIQHSSGLVVASQSYSHPSSSGASVALGVSGFVSMNVGEYIQAYILPNSQARSLGTDDTFVGIHWIAGGGTTP